MYTKQQANYHISNRKNKGKNICNNCKSFNKSKLTCKKVNGYISPIATCNYFTKR